MNHSNRRLIPKICLILFFFGSVFFLHQIHPLKKETLTSTKPVSSLETTAGLSWRKAPTTVRYFDVEVAIIR